MSLLSLQKNGNNNIYLKLIIYEAHLLSNSKNIKNIFPYFISIHIDQEPEKIISPIKNVKEIFNTSNTQYNFFLRKKEKKVLIKINCISKSNLLNKKKIAFCSIKIDNISDINNNGKIFKRWYFLRNSNKEKVIKLLISIDLHHFTIFHNILDNNKYSSFFLAEGENNLTVNKSEKINLCMNYSYKKKFNNIGNNFYMTNFNYTSNSNHFLIKNNNINNSMIKNNYKNNLNLLSNIKNKKQIRNNNLHSIIKNIIKKINQSFSFELNSLKKKNDLFEKEKKEKIIEENNKIRNEKIVNDNRSQLFENKYLGLSTNYNTFEKKIYRDKIQKDLDNYENEVLLNINNILTNYSYLNEMQFDETIGKEFLQEQKTKNSKEKEKNIHDFDGKMNGNIFLNQNKYSSNKKKLTFNYEEKFITDKIIDNDIDIFNEDYKLSNQNKTLMQKKNHENLAKSKSSSPSSEKCSKKRIIPDYSRSTFNLGNTLNSIEEGKDLKINKTKKYKKNILNIEAILEPKNKNNKNKTLYNNLINEKGKRKKVVTNIDNIFNIYYNLESKRKENKFKVLDRNMKNNQLKKVILKQKTENIFDLRKNKTAKNNISYQKRENKLLNVNNTNNKKKIKGNQVFANVVIYNKNKINTKKNFLKKEKINSINILTEENLSSNNSTLGFNSLISNKIKSFTKTISRNSKYSQQNTNTYQKKKLISTIDKSNINLSSKIINKDKKSIAMNINYIINKKIGIKKHIKQTINNQQNKENNKNKFVKNFKNKDKNNLFQNKIIKDKKINKLINKSKILTNTLKRKKTNNDLDKVNYHKKKTLYNQKVVTFNNYGDGYLINNNKTIEGLKNKN